MTHNTFRAQRPNKAVSPVIRQPNTKAVVTTAVFADYVIVFQLSMYHPVPNTTSSSGTSTRVAQKVMPHIFFSHSTIEIAM